MADDQLSDHERGICGGKAECEDCRVEDTTPGELANRRLHYAGECGGSYGTSKLPPCRLCEDAEDVDEDVDEDDDGDEDEDEEQGA